MKKVKIKFVDFWPGFLEKNNYLYRIISKFYNIEISENPDILFFSCYGDSYLDYNCIRVFYSAENMRCDFTGCDFALTFDYLFDNRHYRLPLYAFYIEQQNYWNKLTQIKEYNQVKSEWDLKSKPCCMVVSNSSAKERISFFNKLSKHMQVDSGGRYLNNIGGPVKNKLSFIKDYRFVIAYENSSYPGYTTEKLLEPLIVGSIPIYWGNPNVSQEFNSDRFLDRQKFLSDEALIEKILEINNNYAKSIDIISQPIFKNNELPDCIQEQKLKSFMDKIFNSIDTFRPVSSGPLKFVHSLNKKKKIINYFINRILKKNFR